MRLIRVLSIVLPLFLASAGCPAAWADNDPPVAPENDAPDPPFRDQLQGLVNFYGFHKVNDFCAVAYKSAPDEPDVFWSTQGIYIEVNAGSSDMMDTTHYWDIRTNASLAGHPDAPVIIRHFEVVEGIKDCWAHGKTYIVRKTSGGWTPISRHPEFANIKSQLQYLVDDEATKRNNKFCVVGQQDKAYLAAIVIWQTEQQLRVWLPNAWDKQNFLSVDVSPVQIDLRRDLQDRYVPDLFLMQRSYAQGILKACARIGRDFTIVKSNMDVQ